MIAFSFLGNSFEVIEGIKCLDLVSLEVTGKSSWPCSAMMPQTTWCRRTCSTSYDEVAEREENIAKKTPTRAEKDEDWAIQIII